MTFEFADVILKRRPPLPDGRDSLTARLFIAVDLVSTCCLWDLLGNGTEEEGRSWLVATLGPFGPGVKRDSCGALDGRCRGVSTDQTHISVVTDEVLTVGLKSWSRGQKSQAASEICSEWSVGRHAPPISMHTLSEAVEHLAISCPAHCLLRQSSRLLERRGNQPHICDDGRVAR